MMNQEMQLSYVKMFFLPVKAARQDEIELKYHINHPPIREDIPNLLQLEVSYSFIPDYLFSFISAHFVKNILLHLFEIILRLF